MYEQLENWTYLVDRHSLPNGIEQSYRTTPAGPLKPNWNYIKIRLRY